MKLRYALVFLVTSVVPLAVAGESSGNGSAAPGSAEAATAEIDLHALMLAVGKKMHKHFLFDPRMPRRVDIGDLDEQTITYPQLLAVLQLHGFVVVADGGALLVIPDANARQQALPTVAPDNIRNEDDEWVSTIVPMKHGDAVQLVPILRPLMPQAGQLAAVADRNALLLVDRAADARRLIELIRALDALPVQAVRNP